MRLIVLFMIVCVHCCSISENPDSLEHVMLGITACIGMIGVPLYFFCSGYLFDTTNHKDMQIMLIYKLKGVYLFHLPVAIVANFRFRKYILANYLLLVRPLLVILVTVVLLFVYKYAFHKGSLLLLLVGLKRR